VRDAVAELAPDASIHFLGLPDGGLGDVPEALDAQLASLARGVTHIAAPWEGDRHPDHAACAGAAATAARQLRAHCWQYPIWAWHWADPNAADQLPWGSIGRLGLAAQEQQAKRDATSAHVSQHSPLSGLPGDEPIVNADMLAHFDRPFETFVVVPTDDASTPRYFDRLYATAPDPWGLGTRFYESRKRSVLLASLPRARFGNAFEPGCATGLLTAELARRCEYVLAWDVADSALEQATRRLTGTPNVRVARGAIPDEWPEGEFDLVVLSEVGYYCRDLAALAKRVWTALTDDGVLVACHWRHPAPDHPHTAAEVYAALDRPDRRLASHVEDDFRLDVWSTSGRSVAAETGVVA
jgi:SAM-dependent methyltransferase